MKDGISCKTATKTFGAIGFCILITLSLLLPSFAQTISVSLTIDKQNVDSDWNFIENVHYIETVVDGFVINPFMPSTYYDSNTGERYTDHVIITEEYDSYNVIYGASNKISPNTNFLAKGLISSTAGAINTITFDFCVPTTANYANSITADNFMINISGKAIKPDHVDVISTDPIGMSSVLGAPVVDWNITVHRVLIYLEQPIQTTANSTFGFILPVRSIDFTGLQSYNVGIVWAYNYPEIDYYNSLEEAQNAKIIDSLNKFPNRHKYDSVIDDNESLGGEFSKAGDYEESLYDNLPETSGLPEEIDNNVRTVFGELSFLYDLPFVTTLLTIVISCAVLSYALYGGS